MANFISGGISQPDPFNLTEIGTPGNVGWRDSTRTVVSSTLNGGLKNCILVVAGQSNVSNAMPSPYVVTNTGKVDNFNIYDGATYTAVDPLVGCSGTSAGNGNFCGRLADKLITAGKFDRVILVPASIGGTSIADWSTGKMSGRLKVTALRLAARGLTPTAILWGQGETDCDLGTGTSAYQTGLQNLITRSRIDWPSVPWFIAQQSWSGGITSSNVTTAQANVVNHGAAVWLGPNADSLNATNRQGDNVHFNNTGADAYAALWQTALGLFGAPF